MLPRRLLRDGEIVLDEWHTLAELEALPASERGAPEPSIALDSSSALIVPCARWLEAPERWLMRSGPLGIALAPADPVEAIVPHLPRLALLAAVFPGPGEGRGYTQGRLLRERWHFAGELRAMGYVHQDQVFFLARCGFNSFELPEGELEAGRRALATFSAAYQAANDAGLASALRSHPS